MRARSLVTWALLFTVVVVLIPWPQIFEVANGLPMLDREVYRTKIEEQRVLRDLSSITSLAGLFTNEVLWGWLLDFAVTTLGLSVDGVFLGISAVAIFVAALVVLRAEAPAYLLLLINPLFIDLVFSQMRGALAVALLSVGYLLRCKKVRTWWLAVVAGLLIHTAAFVYVGIAIAASLAGRSLKRSGPQAALIMTAAAGVLFAVVTGPARDLLLGAAGDRRYGAEGYLSDLSLRYIAIWLLVLLIQLVDWRSMVKTFDGRASTILLIMALLGVLWGGYPGRYIALGLPFIIVAITRLGSSYRIPLVFAYVVAMFLSWGVWLRIDWIRFWA